MMRFWLLFLSMTLTASTLHLGTSSNPSRINPIIATDTASSDIADFVFNGLVKYDKDAKRIIGDLAQSFAFEDNRTVIFHLRKNVQWHDGTPLTADDVIFTYNLIHSPTVVSPYTSSFRMVESVSAPDPYHVKVVYKQPYFKALETWMMGIVPKHHLENVQDVMSARFNREPIGTGSHRLKALEFSKQIKLDAYERYFIHRPHIDAIRFHVIPDPTTRFLMLKTGQIDIGSLTPMQLERQVSSSFFDRYNIIEQIAHSYDYLGFNLRLEKFKDPRVRRAISLAIDRQEMVDILFLGHGRICTGPFLPGGSAFNPHVKAPKPDLKKAKSLLAEAGYGDDRPLTFEIATSNSGSTRTNAAQMIQYQLEKIGVKVTLRIMEWQAFLNMVVFPRKFETVLLGWSLPLTPDPYLLWHSDNDKPGAFNFIGYRNAMLDQMIESMQTTVERKKLATLWQEIFAAIVADDPYLFLYIPNEIIAVDKRIKHIEPAVGGIWHNHINWKMMP